MNKPSRRTTIVYPDLRGRDRSWIHSRASPLVAAAYDVRGSA
jgi:hypothetical protein